MPVVNNNSNLLILLVAKWLGCLLNLSGIHLGFLVAPSWVRNSQHNVFNNSHENFCFRMVSKCTLGFHVRVMDSSGCYKKSNLITVYWLEQGSCSTLWVLSFKNAGTCHLQLKTSSITLLFEKKVFLYPWKFTCYIWLTENHKQNIFIKILNMVM